MSVKRNGSTENVLADIASWHRLKNYSTVRMITVAIN